MDIRGHVGCVGRRMSSRTLGVASLVLLPIALPGCGKRVATLVEEHAADYAALDARVAEAQALVAKVPEHGLRAFPRCKPSAAYVYGGDTPNTDVIGGKVLDWDTGPIADALKLRRAAEGKGRFSGPKASVVDERRLAQLAGIANLVVLREHKTSTEDHVSADVFVVSGKPAKITCAFGFDGGHGMYGSVGRVTGKEVWTNKRTGQVVHERDVVEGASSGTSGAFEARNRLPEALARNLGIEYSYTARDAAQRALAGKARALDPFPSLRVKEVLEDRGASRPDHASSFLGTFGYEDAWDTDGVRLTVNDLAKDTLVVVGREHAVSAGGGPDGKALADRLAAESFSGSAELVAKLKSLGWSATAPAKADNPFQGGRRQYAVDAKKGDATAKVAVLDYAEAARKQNGAVMRVVGRTLLVAQGASSTLGPADEILTEITGVR